MVYIHTLAVTVAALVFIPACPAEVSSFLWHAGGHPSMKAFENSNFREDLR